MTKLVRESLNERLVDDLQKFLNINRQQIYDEWKEKIQKEFRHFLPFKNNKDDLDDCRSVWWFRIVEPGWTPKTIRKLAHDYDEELIGNFEEQILDEIFEELGLPHEIME